MKNLTKILVAGMILLLVLPSVKGQRAVNDEKLNAARLLLNDYRDASLFRDMNTGAYDPSWESIFRNCFSPDARIVFDVPFKPDSTLRSTELPTIRKYLELVTISDYIDIIKTGYDTHKITDFSFNFTEIAFDTTNLGKTNKLQFEIRKSFGNNRWSVVSAVSYFVEMELINDQPKITAIRLVDENIARSNVILTFFNPNVEPYDPDYLPVGMVSHIRIEYDETINNRKLIAKTNNEGKVNLGLIPNRASILVDTVIDRDGSRYYISSDWKRAGRKVNSQDVDGFWIPVQPYKWNGFSWSVRGLGGMISQSENQLANFSSESTFTNATGYQFGFGIELVKHLNMDDFLNGFGNWFSTNNPDILRHRRNIFLGVGLGISYYQYQYKITSENFEQVGYDYVDRLGTPVEVFVSGTDYTDITASNGLVVPLFAEIRKVFPDKTKSLQALSFQTGINLTVPFETSYDITGSFSRHGIYTAFNPQPITDDPFYNYYTDVDKKIEEISQKNAISPALMFRINGFFNLSGNKSDNLFDIGLLAYFPLKSSSSSGSGNYYIATGNDDFSSVSNSKNKIYNYFIGLSVGYNFIKYSLY
ncbi:MAG: hypothetical protein IH598_01575 [Bacteroidales bacterium]|nr:hypothetical protein [Bacteroidales bacterium]